MEVFFELLNHFATREEHVQTSERNTILERLGEITEYIELHYKEQISLEEIASHFYLSREYFSRFFKQNMGVNFLRYVNRITNYLTECFMRYTDVPREMCERSRNSS